MHKTHPSIFSIQVKPENIISPKELVTAKRRESYRIYKWKNKFYHFLETLDICTTKMLEIQLDQKGSVYSGLYAFMAISVIIVINVGKFTIPMDETEIIGGFERPLNIFVFCVLSIFYHFFDHFLIMGKNDASSKRHVFYLFLSLCSAYYLSYFTWITFHRYVPTTKSGNNVGRLLEFVWSRMVLYLVLWWQQPSFKKSDRNFKKRYKWFLIYRINPF